MHVIAILDAARDYMRIGMARIVSPEFANLYIGEKGQRLDHVSPHLFAGDSGGLIEHMALSGVKPDEVGVLCESGEEFITLFKHFRRFLTVVRERDKKKVLFRFYDPRVLRAFLPVCNEGELRGFFGPVKVFHCQGDDPGDVLTFSLDNAGKLVTNESTFNDFYEERYGVRPDQVQPIPLPKPPPTLKQNIDNLFSDCQIVRPPPKPQ